MSYLVAGYSSFLTSFCLPRLFRKFVDRLSHHFFWFQSLLLLSLVVFVLSYTLSSGSMTWWTYPHHEHSQGLFNLANQINLPPPYRVNPKHRIKPNEIHETTQPSTVLPTVASPNTNYHQAYPHNYHFIMDNREVCKTKNPFLVLMVPVAPNDLAARDAIRQTWGNSSLVQGKVVLTLFMLGLPSSADHGQQQERLKQENKQHLDLIQSDFMDRYINLTIKTMVIMDWLATRCPNAAYAMKIDSDVFLNVDNLVNMLQKPGIPKTNYLTGFIMWNIPVVRSKNSKWYVPEEMFPDPRYPTYTLGMGYIFSNDLPGKFVEVSKSIKPFNIEDAYIGMCMQKLGLTISSPPDPSQFKTGNIAYNRCAYSKIITNLLQTSQELVKYWTDLKKIGPPC